MNKPSGDAPSPDPKVGEAALKSAQTGEQWLNFAKDAFAVSTERQKGLDALAKEVQQMQLGAAKEQFGWAKEDRARYKNVFQPIENQFIKEASEYGSAEKVEQAAAEARTGVGAEAAASRETARREAAAMGLSPTSGRFAGIERAGEFATAAATAGAANAARTARRDKALALKADVANLGRGLPAQAAQATALGLGAGTGAINIGSSVAQVAQNAANVMHQGFGGAMAGYGQQGSLLNQQYGLQLQGWQAEQELAAANIGGFGKAIGTVVGALPWGSWLSDKKAKTKVKAVPKGKALKAVKAMPVKKFDYKAGQGDSGKDHVGPMAQDFKKATGSGDGKRIMAQDAIGITMQAVKDVDAKVDKLAAAIGIGDAQPRRPSQSPAGARAKPPVKGAYKKPQRPSAQTGFA